MVDPKHQQLSVQRQCELLGVSRSSYYYEPQEISCEELTLLRLMDEQYLKTPFYGSRKYTVFLCSLGYEVNRKRVIRLMNKLGLQSIYPKKRTTVANPNHQTYPYLLRELTIEQANQVWWEHPIFVSQPWRKHC
ncbi:MAG: IS3 family transposase [Microcystaceae cyanobacterium]